MDILLFKEHGPPHRVREFPGVPESGFVWLDFDRQAGRDWAEQVKALTGHEIFRAHVIDSLNLEHPSFADRSDLYEMVVFRGLIPSEDGVKVQSRPTVIFLFKHLAITIREQDSRSAAAVKEELLADRLRIPRRPVGLMHLVLSTMVDRFLEIRQRLSDQLESWQNDLLDPDNPFDDWMLLLRHRNDLRRLEMLVEGQQDALDRWKENTNFTLDASLKVRLHDLAEHIQRVLSHTQHLQLQIDSLVQMHFSATAHRTNEIMRVLTVLSAIFLPLTFLAGVFGMNFHHMPELGYRYSYFIVLGVMVTLAAILVRFFRKKRWI